MTFDELWRSDLARKSGACENAAFAAPGPDFPDEAEVDRVLEWLERSLISGDSDRLATS
jgi:hypothetical protein